MQLKTNITTAFSLLTPGQRRRWMLQLPFGMLASAVEAATVALVYALLALIQDPAAAATLVPEAVRAWLPAGPPSAITVRFLALAFAFLLLRVVLTYADIAYSSRVLARDQAHFAARLYRGYLSLPFAIQLERNVADHVHRLGESIGSVYGTILAECASAVRTLATMLAALAVLFAVQPRATFGIVIGGAVLLLLAMKSLRRINRRLGQRADDAGRARHRTLHEGMESAREIYILGRQHYFAERFRAADEALVRVRFVRKLLRATPGLIVETSVGAVIILVAAAGLAGPSVNGDLVGGLLPVFGLYLYAGLRILPGLANVLVSVGAIEDATVPLARLVADVASMPPESEATDRWRLQRDIVLDGVAFSYGAREVLRDISLRIGRAELVGLAGANGAGKSTLLFILMGLLPPARGTVRVDGRDLFEDPRAWRAGIGYVPQSVRLLDDSVRANILFGYAEPVPERRLEESVREAGLAPDVQSFAEGLDRSAGQAGSRLSGGQRQRVALARALYPDSDLLVLDEVTSALDTEGRAAVDAILEASRGRRTVLVSTHDREVLLQCDRVIYLEDGAVAGDGPPHELAQRCPGLARILAGSASERRPAAAGAAS